MGNLGRYVCVAVPFLLTLGSLIAMLVAGLAGVADKNLYMFQVNTKNLTITSQNLQKLVGSSAGSVFHNRELLDSRAPAITAIPTAIPTAVPTSIPGFGSDASNTKITAADLSLYDLYDVGLWGYCYTPQNGPRACTKPAFNWAEAAMGSTTNQVQSVATSTGRNITLPKEITSAISAFSTITRWTEIVFIIAYVCLGVELFFGIFANCSRAWSCVTWIVAGLAATAVCTAAGLATAMSVVVVGSVESTAKIFGVTASFNTKFLAAVWIGAAFAIAAGFFWIFTICCCKPEHRQSKKHRDSEKYVPTGSYQPINDNQHHGFYNQHVPQYGAPRYPSGGRSDLAYEPYSHGRV